MKVDIGFWNEQGKYIPDIQEIGAEEMEQRAKSCILYNNSTNFNETCMKNWKGGTDNLCVCKVLQGAYCKDYKQGRDY